MNIARILQAVQDTFSKQELLELVAQISRFHRIQGSSDIEKAAEYIYSTLKEASIYDVKIREYSYSKQYGIHLPVVGWDLEECYVEMVRPLHIRLASSIESKMCAVTHSPSGSVEAEVVYIGRGLDLDKEAINKVKGKIVLSYGTPYLVYNTLANADVAGFLFYRPNAPENALPYFGLFLTPEEAEKSKAPAATIPRSSANRIISLLERGEKVVVRIDVKARYRNDAKMKVVEASTQYSEKENVEGEVHIFAHYCHPQGEVNDNVSGTATVIEVARALDRAVSRNIISIGNRKKVVFVVFPEYYGSLPYLIDKVQLEKSKIEFGVNLDMVGEKQEFTRSTLNIILPPRILAHDMYEALLFKLILTTLSSDAKSFNGVSRILRYRLDVLPYDGGSDHDIYLQFAVPSVMLNQWPDIFYHTSEDNIDKFDPDIAKAIGVAVGSFAIISMQKDKLDLDVDTLTRRYHEFREGYIQLKNCHINEASETRVALPKNEKRYRYVGPKGVLSLRHLIKLLPPQDFKELLKLIDEDFKNFLALRFIPLLLMHRALTASEIAAEIQREYCKAVEYSFIDKVLETLTKLGLVETV
jgi:hypothetical protein